MVEALLGHHRGCDPIFFFNVQNLEKQLHMTRTKSPANVMQWFAGAAVTEQGIRLLAAAGPSSRDPLSGLSATLSPNAGASRGT